MEKKFKVVHTDCRFPSLDLEKSIIEPADASLVTGQCQTEEEVIALAHDADAIITTRAPITRKVIEALEKCRVIVRGGIGVDTIDLDAATERGIYIANVPDFCVEEVADHAVTMLMVRARKMLEAIRSAKEMVWDLRMVSPLPRLAGQKLGIFGFGRIGQALARKAIPLGLKILVYDPYLTPEQIKKHGGQAVDFDTLLRESDYISIHSPLTSSTREIFGEAEFRKMKPNAYLINTARGAIVNQAAIVKALKEGWIAGAAIDAFVPEPPRPDDPLLKLPNVVATPHVAWYSDDAMEEARRKAAEEVVHVLKGNIPRNLVNRDVLKMK